MVLDCFKIDPVLYIHTYPAFSFFLLRFVLSDLKHIGSGRRSVAMARSDWEIRGKHVGVVFQIELHITHALTMHVFNPHFKSAVEPTLHLSEAMNDEASSVCFVSDQRAA